LAISGWSGDLLEERIEFRREFLLLGGVRATGDVSPSMVDLQVEFGVELHPRGAVEFPRSRAVLRRGQFARLS
jgi:hypothetical protein